jgi:hypothetical protein
MVAGARRRVIPSRRKVNREGSQAVGGQWATVRFAGAVGLSPATAADRPGVIHRIVPRNLRRPQGLRRGRGGGRRVARLAQGDCDP